MSNELDISVPVSLRWARQFRGTDYDDLPSVLDDAVWIPATDDTLEMMDARSDDDRYLWFAPTQSVLVVDGGEVVATFRADRGQRKYIAEVLDVAD